MTFKEWLCKFKHQQSAVGDLARDVLRDRKAPEVNSRQAWRLHLEELHACDAALDTFGQAWERYLREVKRQ